MATRCNCLSKDFVFETLKVFTKHDKLHFLILASAFPVIPHGLWQLLGLCATVKLLTVLISVIQGGFEEDRRKMLSKYNLQIEKVGFTFTVSKAHF